MYAEIRHYGVAGMRWKHHMQKPPEWKWKNTTGRNTVKTNNRKQLVKRLMAMKKKAGFQTRDVSKLSNEMIRDILNSDQLQTKLSKINKDKLNSGKKRLAKLPMSILKTKIKKRDVQ